MNDTEILDTIATALRNQVLDHNPASPAKLKEWYQWIEQERGRGRRIPPGSSQVTITNWDMHEYKKGGPYHSLHEQRPHFDKDITEQYWRCAHHPSALVNHYGRESAGYVDGQFVPTREVQKHCEHRCDETELRWCDHGTCKPPTSSN